jgi:predicted small lipoprotein YifL
MKRLLLVCATLALVAACGQKGPLYLPPKHGTVVTRPEAGTESNTPATPSSTQPGSEDNEDNSQQQTPK